MGADRPERHTEAHAADRHLRLFGQHQFTQWGYVFAMSVASLLPVLIIFICCQKYFVSGLQTGGIKG